MPPAFPVPAPVEQLVALLAQPQPIRRGSLYQRTIKCNKPECSCAESKDARHGPYFTLTWAAHGRHHLRALSPQQADVAQSQIEAGRRFRKNVDDYWDACERWADAQLETSEAADEAAKKGASNKPSTRKSKRKFRRS